MDLQFRGKFDLGDTEQIFLQNCRFNFELMLVVGMLVVAAATAVEIRTSRFNPLCLRRQDHTGARSSKARLLFEDNGFDLLSLKDERNKYGFASATFVSRQTCQTVAAIYELFYCEFQGLILQTFQ